MIWGKWALANATAVIAELKNHTPHARFIFGFNEPDHSGSWLKPQDAAARWPAMEECGASAVFVVVFPGGKPVVMSLTVGPTNHAAC